MGFNPDEYLANTPDSAGGGFNPDEYLAGDKRPSKFDKAVDTAKDMWNVSTNDVLQGFGPVAGGVGGAIGRSIVSLERPISDVWEQGPSKVWNELKDQAKQGYREGKQQQSDDRADAMKRSPIAGTIASVASNAPAMILAGPKMVGQGILGGIQGLGASTANDNATASNYVGNILGGAAQNVALSKIASAVQAMPGVANHVATAVLPGGKYIPKITGALASGLAQHVPDAVMSVADKIGQAAPVMGGAARNTINQALLRRYNELKPQGE